MSSSSKRLGVAVGAFLACLVAAGPASAAGLSLDWQDCGDAGAQCATASVPKDYDQPGLGTLDVDVAKSPATGPGKKLGSLFFNFGGPGAQAAPYIEAYGADLFPVLNQRFDIVGLDPRGSGTLGLQGQPGDDRRLLQAVHDAGHAERHVAADEGQPLHLALPPAQREPAVPLHRQHGA